MTKNENFTSEKYWAKMTDIDNDLRAIIDPNDKLGYKNYYIDLLSKTAIERVISFDKIEDALDFGCGLGRISSWLANKGVERIEATDGIEEMVNKAKRKLTKYDNINVSLYKNRQLPYNDNVFDLVTVGWVLQHVINTPAVNDILSEINRVIKCSGVAVFIERTSNNISSEKGMSEDYILHRSVNSYKKLFKDNGLKINLCYPIRTSVPICNFKPIQKLLHSGKISVQLFPSIIKLDLFLQKRNTNAQWADTLFLCSKKL